jgi:hypothetical protein
MQLSVMRRAPQLGQKPRRLQLYAHQLLGTAGVAAHPQEAVLQTAAFEVFVEFALDITR